jgi:hypothetical protein
MYDCLQGFLHHRRAQYLPASDPPIGSDPPFSKAQPSRLRVRLSVCGNLHLLHAKPISSCGIGQRQLRR